MGKRVRTILGDASRIAAVLLLIAWKYAMAKKERKTERQRDADRWGHRPDTDL